MPFIDWSDSEGMLDLLVEFIRDAINESTNDPGRKEFLCHLQAQINALRQMNQRDAANQLRFIHNSITNEFLDDPVVLHIRDCIEELDHLNS